ncbi:cytochrome P450 [Neomegalonema sp.]|uniref:cytochrome P450 n=1 Tax=Neomegalonema sp. TaxID=2039713 RepID=UPI00260C5B0C|nr:cytochrome P450 [Neomegalonema sp.]MDD2867239.1 cytochrome P450 [Neomegalonema sp.]
MAEPALPPRFSPPPRPLTLLRAFWRMLRGADDMEMVPQTAYEEFLVEQPVLFGPRVFYATGPEETRRLLVENAANYHKSLLTRRILGPGLREGLILAEDEVWRRQRRAIAPLFQPRVFEGYAAAMTRAGTELAEAWARAPGGIVRASEGTARATYDVIMATLFGGGAGFDRQELRKAVDVYLDTAGRLGVLDLAPTPSWLPRPRIRRGARAVAGLRDAFREMTVARRAQRGASATPDLLDRLIAAEDPETGARLDDEAIVDNILTLIVAGHETTALALAWSLHLLATHPEAQERAAAEIREVLGEAPARLADVARLPWLKQVLNEALRLYPTIPAALRTAAGPDRLGDLEIRAGDVFIIPLYAIHRHRRLWENPDAFDPDRFSPERAARIPKGAFLPFGAGPRICVGASFALTEAVLILAEILRRLSFAPLEGVEVRPLTRLSLKPTGGPPLRVAPRAAAGGA